MFVEGFFFCGVEYMCKTRRQRKKQTKDLVGYMYRTGVQGGVLTGCRMHDNSTGGEGTER